MIPILSTMSPAPEREPAGSPSASSASGVTTSPVAAPLPDGDPLMGDASTATHNGASSHNGVAHGNRSVALFAPIAADLAEAERLIQGAAEVEHPVLRQTLRLILSAGGKRLRPALTLLAARLHDTDLSRRAELAVAAELLHTATLIHDDVLDVSEARRGQPTINAAFSNTLAVLTGDYLFGKSGELVAGLDDPAIMGVFSWAVMELVKGEMSRPSLEDDLAVTEAAYLAKIRGKTASLFAMCCETGAMLDSLDTDRRARLRDYGMNLGMAFQIVDDVLDYTATEEQLGKPVGSDLRHGTITLPALLYLRRVPDDEVVRGLLTHDETMEPRADDAVRAIRESGAVEEAEARARAYAEAALRRLEGLPKDAYLTALMDLACYAVERHE